MSLDIFKETPHFYEKYGYDASLEDLTDSSTEFLNSLEKRLKKKYHRIMGSDEIRKERKNLGVESKHKDRWKCTPNTATLASKTMPYFPKKLGKLLRDGSGGFYDYVDEELEEYMNEYWDMRSGSGTSRKERVDSINRGRGRGGDRSQGYLIFPWERVSDYFSPHLIEDVGRDDFLGGRIEMHALEKMCKDREHLIEYYPNFSSFYFHKKYELNNNKRFIPVNQINIPERWELYL